MLKPKNLKGFLDYNLLKSIISEFVEEQKEDSEFELIQLSIFTGFSEIEDWLNYYYNNVIKSGNCYEISTAEGIKVIILRVATKKEDEITIFPFYKKMSN